ncbi:MAG: GIY-YIG nuclease family protein [Tissierellia bacterium]|nr:GIY-YIG nuclease family protein [Tissierellia bacterium]
MNYVYIVRCSDNSLYTGRTNNLQKRIETHNSGKGAKYTRSRLPVKLVYKKEFETKNDALKYEKKIKSLKKSKKEELVLSYNEDI